MCRRAGKYYIATMMMVTTSTALTIFIMNIHHCGPEGRPVPAWAERFILQYLARVCFVYEAADERPGGPESDGGGKRDGEARAGDASARKDDTSVALDEGGEAADGQRSGGGAAENRKEACRACHQGLCRNVEYIANAYQDQRAAQLRMGEWKKLAKVMDRFFMWLFFLMVFIMSVLILGKAV